jgi:hypothetical protein
MDRTKKLGRIKAWMPSFIVMIVISILSSINGPFIDSFGLNRQTYQINGHFFLFMLLCAMYFKATKNIFYSIILTLNFGIVDEFHQVFTSFRSSSVFDIFVDIAGGLISGGIIWRFQHILPKRLGNWLLR